MHHNRGLRLILEGAKNVQTSTVHDKCDISSHGLDDFHKLRQIL